MPLYLVSFNYGTMELTDDDLPEVAREAHAVVDEAAAAGVLVFAGGVGDPAQTTVVGRDGRVSSGPTAGRREFIGGMTVIDVPDRDTAHFWAAKIAKSCRCPQDVREFLPGSQTAAARY